jgi:hypothetical protein
MSMRPIVCGLAAALAMAAVSGADEPRGVVVEVEAGRHARAGTPVVFPLPDELKTASAFTLEGIDDRRPVAVQLLPGDPPSVSWIIRDALPAGASRSYRLEPARDPGKPAVTCTDDGKRLVLKAGDRPVLSYNHAVVESPAGISPVFRRSGHIHPLLTPTGLEVTDDFPPDHAHQHALFFAWVNTTFDGRDIDFWNQSKKTGRVEHAETLGTTSGPVFGQFRVRLRHEDITSPTSPRPALDEVWTIRAYSLSDTYLVDIESRQSCAGSEPLTLNKYHYGGFGLRGNRAWFDPKVKGDAGPDPSRSGRSDFLTSEGKGRRDGNHTRPRWVDLSGYVGDRAGGVAILDDPGNFRFPQPVRLHPNKPYFCFAPMVLGGFAIEPGRPYVSRYRLVVHDGMPDVSAIERAWDDYADPPRVRVVR